MSMVKIEIVGFIRTEPETRFTNDGKKVLSFSVPHDNRRGETEWYQCSIWGENRVDALGWLKKDIAVFVRGDLTIAEKDGKVYRNVFVDELQIIGGKKREEASEEVSY